MVDKDSLWCMYCKKPRHTKDKCWKLVGKPQWAQTVNKNGGGNKTGQQTNQRSQGQANLSTGQSHEEERSQGQQEFNKEDIQRLKTQLGSFEKPSGNCSLAFSGECSNSHAFNVSDKDFSNSWVLDSRATDHMTNSSKVFTFYNPSPSNRKISTADGSLTTVAGLGEVCLSQSIVLKNVLHVPKLSTNLMSVNQLTQDLKCHVIFYPSQCLFQDQDTGKTIGRAKEKNGLYYLELLHDQSRTENRLASSLLTEKISTKKEKLWLHHRRLGHPSFSTLKIMFPLLFKGINVDKVHCDICELVKHRRVSFPISQTRTLFPFDLIHSDIWGPSTISNIFGARWLVLFIDDCTRVTWLFLLKHKSEVSSVFPIFHKMIRNQFGVGIKRLRSDNRRDYFNQFLSPYLQKEGIIHESSCVATPQQNGVAERKNGHLLAIIRCFLFQTMFQKCFRGKQHLQQLILSIGCHLEFWGSKVQWKFYPIFFQHTIPQPD